MVSTVIPKGVAEADAAEADAADADAAEADAEDAEAAAVAVAPVAAADMWNSDFFTPGDQGPAHQLHADAAKAMIKFMTDRIIWVYLRNNSWADALLALLHSHRNEIRHGLIFTENIALERANLGQ